MGNVVPDRFFWAMPPEDEDGEGDEDIIDAMTADIDSPTKPRSIH